MRRCKFVTKTTIKTTSLIWYSFNVVSTSLCFLWGFSNLTFLAQFVLYYNFISNLLISRSIKIQQTPKNLLYIILNLTPTWNQLKTSPKCPELGRIRQVANISQLFLKQNFAATAWWQVRLTISQHADYSKAITLRCHFLKETKLYKP